ncbi:MAG: hypothetical protein ACRDJP_01550 [Actinomycetota bacterium]
MRGTLVLIHASAGIAGLITGLVSLAPPRTPSTRRWWRGVYLLCIAVLLATLTALIAIDWDSLDGIARIAFPALAVLAVVMAVRVVRANQVAVSKGSRWRERYIDHVYFSYISLWEGFVILPALNLPLPQVTVPVVAIAVLLVGHVLITRYKRAVLTA